MFIYNNPYKLYNWLLKEKVQNNDSINKFVNGIEKDLLAVKNGIELTCNNALADGTVNKIKVIKRIMYGRASLELLTKKALLLN